LIYLNEPKDAVQAAACCIENLPRGIPEVSLPFQMLIRGYLRLNNLGKAMEVADRALKHDNGQPDSRFNIWYLFKAAILLSLKKFKESNQVLISHDQHFGDNMLQKTFYLLYELVNIFELGDFYWFDYKFESFRKRIQRLTIKEIERIRYLYDLLNLLKRNNSHFRNDALDHTSGHFLTPHDLSASWDPLGFEVINIEEWFRNKMVPARMT
jgi:hypothetical protein